MPPDPLRWELSEGVARVVIDHPPTNLVDGAFIGALFGLLRELEVDERARVVVFSSADPDFFLMHGDVQGILAIPPGEHEPATEPNVAAALFERLRRSRLVSIGVVDGAARGGGAEFLAALDLRFGSERAVLGQPEVAPILPADHLDDQALDRLFDCQEGPVDTGGGQQELGAAVAHFRADANFGVVARVEPENAEAGAVDPDRIIGVGVVVHQHRDVAVL